MRYLVIIFSILTFGCNSKSTDKAVAKIQKNSSSKAIQRKMPEMDKTFPFSETDKVEVVSFNHMDFSADEKSYDIVDGKLPFNDNIIKERIVLTEKQRNILFNLLHTDDCTEGIYEYDCYMPQHRIIFYNDDKIIAFLEVCLQCAGSVASKNFETATLCEAKINEFGDFFKSIGIKQFIEM